ncbi:uncharacterized protein LOC122405456 isoform X2 [Colletes gigas]|uniref:uncharacterized protein LOC122405456 isoform X2 n=1 Tax=Colletes gigas TaxID=935657 RepID=UPI001C9AB1A9|nr:uncharacterized protein LOC122405456 isoform X2 [Colletes gigas]
MKLGGNSKLHSNFQRSELFHKIGDWFIDLKNQLYQKLYGQTTTTTPATLSTEVLDLNKLQLETRLRNREWHQIDLSTLSFNPDEDWGFRVGNWYFIRKRLEGHNGFEKNNSIESDFHLQSTIQPTNPTEVETKGTSDHHTNSLEITESSQIISPTTVSMIHDMGQLTTQETTIQTSTQVDTSVNSLLVTEILLDKNEETNIDSVHKGSVEVLMD